jgi:hypothetical protein
MAINTMAQDTLRFKNGNKIAVKILQVDAGTGTISYEEDGSNKILNSRILSGYFIQGIWIETNDKSTNAAEKPIRYGVFGIPLSVDRGPWAVQFNLISPFVPNMVDGDYYWNYFKSGHFSSRPSLNISLEKSINSRLAIKIPVFYGHLGVNTPTGLDNPEYYNQINVSEEYNGNFTQMPTLSFPNNYYNDNDYPHGNNMLYQIGFYPKFYPKGHTTLAWFLSPGLSYGTGDFLAADYYLTYDFIDGYWRRIQDEIKVESNPFNYVRFEFLTGLDWSYSKNFSLSSEFGVGGKMQNNGATKDRLFMREDGGEYEQVDTRNYVPYYYNNLNWALRFHLVYHFNGMK